MDLIVWYNMYIIINDTSIRCTADQRNPKQNVSNKTRRIKHWLQSTRMCCIEIYKWSIYSLYWRAYVVFTLKCFCTH